MTPELEKETRQRVILPALHAAGWSREAIREEFPVKAAQATTWGGVQRDLGDGRVDYMLEIVPGLPVAVIEAKRAYHSAREGRAQALRYAQQLDVPVAYATNGVDIIEHDLTSGVERPVTDYRTPIELWADYCRWKGIDASAGRLLQQSFNRNKRTASGHIVQPRWYQQTAVNRVLAAMLAGQTRLLLLMATGTGKTYTAMQIVEKLRSYRLLVDPSGTYRVLYLADRDALVQQPIDKDFGTAFGGEPLHRVQGGRPGKGRDIIFATYQALSGDRSEEAQLLQYPSDFFDLVIVDECHRGSAAENSLWRGVLDHFRGAVQLGLTATPKQDETVDTYRYFGDPVFSYSLRQGIEDGYLAPYRVRRVVMSPDAEGWEPDEGEVDASGRLIEAGVYTTRDFERKLKLPTRTRLAAEALLRRLDKEWGRAIVFCVDVDHAEDMRRALVAARPEWTRDDPEWVVRITGDEGEKKRLIKALCDPERGSPLVATTSRLLATGVDIEDLRYVVIFRPVGSKVEFKQIVGRGTRLYPDKGKMSFEIIDFVGASEHFSDPDFDGFPQRIDVVDEHGEPLEGGSDGTTPEGSDDSDTPSEGEGAPGEVVAEPEPEFSVGDPPSADVSETTSRSRPYLVEGGDFEILTEAVLVPDRTSGQMVLTEYGRFAAGRVQQLAESPLAFARQWADPEKRRACLADLRAAGVDVDQLGGPAAESIDVCDLLMNLAWNQKVRTRAERARGVRERHHEDLERRSAAARRVLEELLTRYEAHGIDDITSAEVFELPPFPELGGRRGVLSAFGGGPAWRSAVSELQEWIYSTEAVS